MATIPWKNLMLHTRSLSLSILVTGQGRRQLIVVLFDVSNKFPSDVVYGTASSTPRSEKLCKTEYCRERTFPRVNYLKRTRCRRTFIPLYILSENENMRTCREAQYQKDILACNQYVGHKWTVACRLMRSFRQLMLCKTEWTRRMYVSAIVKSTPKSHWWIILYHSEKLHFEKEKVNSDLSPWILNVRNGFNQQSHYLNCEAKFILYLLKIRSQYYNLQGPLA